MTKIPDATPVIIETFALTDEQALLAKLRYNRLVDLYCGVAAYPLQSHLRTTVPVGPPGDEASENSQVETDEIYVGVDTHGAQYIFPIQAKGGSDFLNVVQIWQDFKVCAKKFPSLLARPVGAQFMADDVIALFTFEWDGADGISIAAGSERHYRLVPEGELSDEDLARYREAAT